MDSNLKIPLLFALASLALLSGSLVTCEDFPGQEELAAATLALSRKSSLSYSDRCSLEEEKRRGALWDERIGIISRMEFYRIPQLSTDMLQLAKTARPFCSEYLNLQCNSTGLCDCVNDEVDNLQFKATLEDGLCKMIPDSICAPEEMIPVVEGRKMELRCEGNIECVTKSESKPCSPTNMQKEIDKFGAVGTKSVSLSRDFCICGTTRVSVSSLLFLMVIGFTLWLN